MQTDPHLTLFQRERRRLAGLAYRMTGSVADTEDILQQAWIRFAAQPLAGILDPARYLGTVVARLCLDHLKSARLRRERYVGAWLPDPLVQDSAPDTEQNWVVAEDVGIALILTLDRLTPEMRAAFLLRDAFDYSFDEIAAVVGRTPATCRQLVSRARKRMAGADPGPVLPPEQSAPIVAAFWHAARTGDMQALTDIFAEEIEVHTDGGGKVPAAINVLRGRRRAAGLFVGLARKRLLPPPPVPPLRLINGVPGFVTREPGNVLQTTAIGIRAGKIVAVWIVRNPDKLRHLAASGRYYVQG
ncbi:RNA polymerase sigma factor SigJ [Roseinatronobacter alkalisoli]|uniref:RNA polymerase sigma factor SigJ n=1 Tax=Roseinatronobacter alkalisoli TaxID=3028235 RepID=A0ABT5T6T3_9RHOB|nr:RNA polymerase sigma factor SigJ [Roseinatronobacter sp. HJB301]MDD7970826.1 RNA polymerase sigma factor SigJ [Roseinatronobacter sp. HJB301]